MRQYFLRLKLGAGCVRLWFCGGVHCTCAFVWCAHADGRAEVRNCALQTLLPALVTHGRLLTPTVRARVHVCVCECFGLRFVRVFLFAPSCLCARGSVEAGCVT